MVVRKKGLSEERPQVDAMDKIAALLAVIATKDMKPDDAAILLDNIGFSGSEITQMLGVGEAYVRQIRFARRKGKKKKKAKAS